MVEYSVRHAAGKSMAKILIQRQEVGSIGRGSDATFLLEGPGRAWKMDPRVHGEIRPFSMRVTSVGGDEEPVLTIRNHLFFNRRKAYYMTGIPEEVRPEDHLLGVRHVSRLDRFPFSTLEEVDAETWGRLRLHRGASVGTIEGAGSGDYKVTLGDELEEIGVPLAASAFLLYTEG